MNEACYCEKTKGISELNHEEDSSRDPALPISVGNQLVEKKVFILTMLFNERNDYFEVKTSPPPFSAILWPHGSTAKIKTSIWLHSQK